VERAGGGGNRVVEEEVRAAEARVALAALGVEDPELRPPPRRTEPVPGDGHLRLLADDVASEPNPRPAGELEAEAGRFRDGSREAGGEARRLEGDEQRLRPTGEGREAAQPVGDLRGGRAGVRARRQVDDEQVDRSAGEQRPGDREALVERVRRQDHEPVEPDAAGDGLDRVEGAGEVQPGDDRAIGLGLRGEAEGERRLARAGIAAKGDARTPRQSTGAEDRVERGKTGPDDPLDAARRRLRRLVRLDLGGQWRRRQRPDDPRSCRSPARLEGRQSRRHVRRERRHRVDHRTDVLIEQWYSPKIGRTRTTSGASNRVNAQARADGGPVRELIEQARRGDRAAYEQIVRRKVATVYRTARAILGNDADAEDAAQDALIGAWRQIGSLRDVDRFDAWLGRITVNACRMTLRRRSNAVVNLAQASQIELTDTRASGIEGRTVSAVAFDRAFDRLPVEQRSILVLHHHDELPVAEIATRLGVPEGTVKSRLHAARAALDRSLVREGLR